MGGGPIEMESSEFSDYCIVGEVSMVQLLYSKSKVYVYRSVNREDRISGFICIVKGPDDQYYMAWTPEALLSEHDRESYVQIELCPNFGQNTPDTSSPKLSMSMVSDESNILISTEPLSNPSRLDSVSNYAFCKPVGEITSLLIHPPSLTSWYGSVILNLSDGSSLAPMWFHDDESASSLLGMTRHWGGDELLVWLAHVVDIEKSSKDPNLYEIKGSKTPHIIRSNPPTPMIPAASAETSMPASTNNAQPGQVSTRAADKRTESEPLADQMKELQWNILERFSRITRTVKDAAVSFIETPVGQQVAPFVPPSISARASVQRTGAAGNLVKEYEGARIYLAKWAAQHIIRQQREDGQRESERAKDAGGTSPTSHAVTSIWEEWISEDSNLGPFELISTNKSASLPQPVRTQKPLSAEVWFSYFDGPDGTPAHEGRLLASSEAIRRTIFAGGIDEDIRPAVWRYLLGIYAWDSTEDERASGDRKRKDEYWILKEEWVSDQQLRSTQDYIEQASRVEKDVLRTDRDIPMFATDSAFGGNDEDNLADTGLPGSNTSLEQMKDILMTYHHYDKKELGYVQGMSDLLAPLYFVFQDEETTFWAFVSFMNRMRAHFLKDQSGMQDELDTLRALVEIANPQLYRHLDKCDSSNMFCCYRWLLIWFKREFTFDGTLRLWEVLWTDFLTDRFVLFVAVAILQRHADVMMDHLQSPDEILKYIQDLSETIDLNDALKGAEMAFYKTRHRVNIVQRARSEQGLPLFEENAGSSTTREEEEVPLISFDEEEGVEDAVERRSQSNAETESRLPSISAAVHRIFSESRHTANNTLE